jgi:hypothetical protein
MTSSSLDDLCESGQELLIGMRYLEAEAVLGRAEGIALATKDWERLARLYLPLQEARRQRRQRCGEGIVRLDLLAEGPHDHFEARHVLENYSHGQLLVAGWGTLEPAARVRALAAEHGLYVETFLGAVYPAGNERVVIVAPLADVPLPQAREQSLDELMARVPGAGVAGRGAQGDVSNLWRSNGALGTAAHAVLASCGGGAGPGNADRSVSADDSRGLRVRAGTSEPVANGEGTRSSTKVASCRFLVAGEEKDKEVAI